jgi:hypothetical protein
MGDYDTAVATPGFFHVSWSDNRFDLSGGAPRKDPNVFYKKIPLGSLVYDPTTSGAIGFVGDTDRFTLNVDAGLLGQPGGREVPRRRTPCSRPPARRRAVTASAPSPDGRCRGKFNRESMPRHRSLP